jgi:hypothetical protein
MSDAENSDGSDEHPLHLAVDINDWAFAGDRLLRVVERLGRCVPPSGLGPAQELAQLIACLDVELTRHRDVWTEIIRPRLIQYENPPPLPDWIMR